MYPQVDKAKNTFKSFAKVHKLKNTKEREKIIEAICKIHAHFDVKDLITLLKKQKLTISRATIYRTLNLFVDLGLLNKLSFDESYAQYEYALEHKHHDHLICIKCNKVIEFIDEQIEERQSLICDQYNFKETEHSLQIFGICKECQGL